MVVLHRVLAALSLAFLFIGATRRHAPTDISPEELYSVRALRRARLIIELRLLEFRKERLECVRLAILRNLPPELRPAGERDGGDRTLRPETCRKLLR